MGTVWKLVGWITVGSIALAAIAGFMVVTKTGFIVIDGWEVGVKKERTNYVMTELEPGYHFFNPILDTVDDINTRPVMFNYTKSDATKKSTQEIRYSGMITGVDKNGIPLSFAIAFEIKPERTQMAEMYQETGSYENALDKKAIQPNKSMIKDVMGQFDAKTIQSQRNEVSKMLNDKFTKSYAENEYFTLEGIVDLKEIELPQKIQDGQIAVQLAAQDAEKSEEEIVKAQNQAKALVKAAEGIAQKKRIESQGIADAVLIEATAKAKANKLISASITEKILRADTIQAWREGGAQVPHLVGSEKSQYILPLK